MKNEEFASKLRLNAYQYISDGVYCIFKIMMIDNDKKSIYLSIYIYIYILRFFSVFLSQKLKIRG